MVVQRRRLHLAGELGLEGLGLVDERLVDVRDDTTTGDRGLDQRVQLLVTTDGELHSTVNKRESALSREATSLLK